MKIQCKIFSHTRVHELERMINDFLHERERELVAITQSVNAEGGIYISIWFRDEEEMV